jgi:hypothetical protein
MAKILPRLAAEEIVPQIIESEPKTYFSEQEMKNFRARWGERLQRTHPGAPGCGTSRVKAVQSTNRPVITLENDFVPVRFLKKRLQQEVLDFLPDDWACCFAGGKYTGGRQLNINPMIAVWEEMVCAQIVLWRNNADSKRIIDCIVSGECYCYSSGNEHGFVKWAAKNHVPLYATRLCYGGQDIGESETPEKRINRHEELFFDGSSRFGDGLEIVHRGTVVATDPRYADSVRQWDGQTVTPMEIRKFVLGEHHE